MTTPRPDDRLARDVVSLREVSHASARQAACDPPWIPGDVRPASRRPSHHRHPRRHRPRPERHRPRRNRDDSRGQPGDRQQLRDRRDRQLHRAVPHARNLRGRGERAGLPALAPGRRDPAGQPARARGRDARSRRYRGDHDGHGRSAAAEDRFVRGRDGHRRAGDQGAAAERPQLRDAGLPDAGHHAWAGQREPVGRQHLQSPRRLELQRARPPGQRQRLADRRDRQQRVHVQHRDHRALGRAGARVQGAVGGLLGGVRPRRRRGLGCDQVGQQPAARHGVRVPARRRLRRAQLLRAQGVAGGRQPGEGSEAAAESPPVRSRGRRSAGASRVVRRPQPHLLLRRLRGTEREARAGVRQHGADGADAHRQLQRLPRSQRQPDHHLRSADHAPQSRRSTRPGRSAPRIRSSCAIPIPTTSSRPSA